jgi:hypothetical protein
MLPGPSLQALSSKSMLGCRIQGIKQGWVVQDLYNAVDMMCDAAVFQPQKVLSH